MIDKMLFMSHNNHDENLDYLKSWLTFCYKYFVKYLSGVGMDICPQVKDSNFLGVPYRVFFK